VEEEAGYLRRELRRLTGLDNISGKAEDETIFDMIRPLRRRTPSVDHRGERDR